MFLTGERDENGFRWGDMAAKQPKDPQSFFWHKGVNFSLHSVWFYLFYWTFFSPIKCQEEMKKLAEGGEDAGVIGRLGVELEGRSLLRDWDRNKV